jgi:hypothetical protein
VTAAAVAVALLVAIVAAGTALAGRRPALVRVRVTPSGRRRTGR